MTRSSRYQAPARCAALAPSARAARAPPQAAGAPGPATWQPPRGSPARGRGPGEGGRGAVAGQTCAVHVVHVVYVCGRAVECAYGGGRGGAPAPRLCALENPPCARPGPGSRGLQCTGAAPRGCAPGSRGSEPAAGRSARPRGAAPWHAASRPVPGWVGDVGVCVGGTGGSERAQRTAVREGWERD